MARKRLGFTGAVDAVNTEIVVATETRPQVGDEAWNDYIMGKFLPDEMIDGCPTVDGLRRVAEVELGEIINSDVNVIQSPSLDNGYRACVTCAIEIILHEGPPESKLRRVTETADVGIENCDRKFAIYPTATAASRAEGRALRKLLRLRKVITAEEASRPVNDNELVNETQITAIKFLCQSLDINVGRLLGTFGKYKKLSLVPYEKGGEILQKLNEYQSSEIPVEIQGFEEE